MRLLYLVPSFYPAFYHGGPVITSYHLCNTLAESGVELRVLTTDTAGPTRNLDVTDFPTVMPAGYPVFYCRRVFSVSVSPGILWRMINMIRWADVVHLIAVYSFPTIPALLICKLLNKPVIWSPKGSFQRWERSTNVGFKRIWNRICRLVAPRRLILHTTSEDERTETLLRFPSRETVAVPNGVKVPTQVKHSPGDGALRLLYLGRLDPIKGIDNLLVACKGLNNGSRAPWSLTIAGSGDVAYAGALGRQIGDLSLTEQVSLVGEVGDADKELLFENADLLVLPSHQESFGMVVAEAMAHGVPVLVSRRTPWQQVEQIGCGMWVDNDSESLTESIRKLQGMPLQEMGRRGRVWMENEFSWERRAGQMVDLYEKALNL